VRSAIRGQSPFAAAAVLGVLSCGWARPAHADPQASVGLTGGASFGGVIGPVSQTTLHLGGRADVLFLRQRERDMAVGPYVDVGTRGFHDVDVGGGGEWLIPLTEDVPIVASAGMFARSGSGGAWSPGIETTLFCGSRSYNFHSWYGLAAGVFVQSRWVPTSPASLDIVAGVQLDLALIAMPFILAYEAVAH
jgi:hypothetical protein